MALKTNKNRNLLKRFSSPSWRLRLLSERHGRVVMISGLFSFCLFVCQRSRPDITVLAVKQQVTYLSTKSPGYNRTG